MLISVGIRDVSTIKNNNILITSTSLKKSVYVQFYLLNYELERSLPEAALDKKLKDLHT